MNAMDAEGEGSYDATCGPERTGRVVAAGIERIDSPPAPTPLPVVNGGGADVREGRMVRGVMEVVRRVDRSELVDVPVADVDVDVVLSVKKSEPVAVEVSVSVLEVVVALPSLVEVLVVVVSVAAVSVVPVVTDAPHAPVVVVVVVVDFLSASVDVPVLVVDLSDVDDLLDVESSAGDLVATTVEVPGSGAIPVAPAGEPSETECGLGITSGGGVLMIDVVCGASVAGPSPLGDAPGVVVWPPGVVAGVEMSRGVDVGGVMADDGVSPGIGSSAPAGVVAPMRVGAVMVGWLWIRAARMWATAEDSGGTLRSRVHYATFGLSDCPNAGGLTDKPWPARPGPGRHIAVDQPRRARSSTRALLLYGGAHGWTGNLTRAENSTAPASFKRENEHQNGQVDDESSFHHIWQHGVLR